MALKTVTVMFGDESQSAYPHVWLRENCQCHECFNQDAIARLFLLEDLDLDMRPKNVRVEDGCLRVEWEDGHIGLFSGLGCTSAPSRRRPERSTGRSICCPGSAGGPGFQVPLIDYQSAMEDDRVLLDWLTLLERFGVVLITNAPQKVGAINDFINNIGFIKPTHYGTDYETGDPRDPE
nr:gamma-butyrobetaine dioxygenase-like [Penaeus vannamei]